jgi:hypothetical protein
MGNVRRRTRSFQTTVAADSGGWGSSRGRAQAGGRRRGAIEEKRDARPGRRKSRTARARGRDPSRLRGEDAPRPSRLRTQRETSHGHGPSSKIFGWARRVGRRTHQAVTDVFVRGLNIFDGGALADLLASTHVEQGRLCAARRRARWKWCWSVAQPRSCPGAFGPFGSGCPLYVGTRGTQTAQVHPMRE